ncbi:hypothetical protein Lal_00024619 [Lupinus albus]|uniref:Uncharacterized protein n=1 Tax=Lupinus albus TaxID=3870 RepID=A0A6A4PVY3_LUPAL|nr:hypothetical protein Lalb_Chr10g0099171 [Lupinus albus]KAF1889296.1 hypothetical protein Lal_00024619 [Lupinus albus]
MLSRKMGFIITITLLSIFFLSALLPPSTSLHTQLQYSVQHQELIEAVNANKQQLSLPVLPRKLSFTNKVQEYAEVGDLASHKQKDSLPAGKQYHKKQNMVVGSKGTNQEWLKGDNPTKYFTMDYPIVRRKRPIHNKHLPFVP